MMASLHRVDAQNFHIESASFLSAAYRCRSPLVFLDTEFPGNIFRSPKHYAELSAAERYAIVKLNADVMRPIQVGITLSDGGSSSSTWQFELCDFNLRRHLHAPGSIALLESSGIDLKRNSQLGIHSTLLVRLLHDAGLVGLCSTATWVAFHGCYDFAVLLKALFQLTNGRPVPLPDSLEVFMGLTRCLFGGYIYDVKCIMRNCDGLYGGLERVAEKLKVERAVGKAHQAGSDSLLLCHVFLRIKKMFFSDGNDGEEKKMLPSEGVIFGLTA